MGAKVSAEMKDAIRRWLTGNKSERGIPYRSAKNAGIDPSSLYRKIKQLKLKGKP